MAKVIPIGEARGTGRPDFSTNVEVATVPIIRSHQSRISATLTFPLPPQSMVYFFVTRVQELLMYKSIWFNLRGFVDANVLTFVKFGIYNSGTGVFSVYATRYGYQVVDMTIPKGILFEPLGPNEYITTAVANYGEISTIVAATVHGLYDKLAES